MIRARMGSGVVLGIGSWAPRSRLDGIDAVFTAAGEESVEVTSGVLVSGGGLGDRELPSDDLQYRDASL